MKTILSRLEALEAHNPGSIVLQVKFPDESVREMSVAEFMEIPKEQLQYPASVGVISGNNRKEILEYSDRMREFIRDLLNYPLPNRNIEDYE